MNVPRTTRRQFLKGLGALALLAIPACRRAAQFAITPEETPEWMLPGEAVSFASCMPWAGGAIPLLAVCHDGVVTGLQSNPQYPRAGLPAFAQAALADLYSEGRRSLPQRFRKDFPWEGLAGSFRAWSSLIREGHRTGFLFPEGYSPLRQAQCDSLRALPQVNFYAWDPVAEPRSRSFPELEQLQEQALGRAVKFPHGFGSLADLQRELPQLDLLFIFTPADPAGHVPSFATALETCAAEVVRFCLREDATAALSHYVIPQTHFLEEWGAEADAAGNICLRQPVTFPLRPALSEAEALHALLTDGTIPPVERTGDSPAHAALRQTVPDCDELLRRGYREGGAPQATPLEPVDGNRYLHPWYVDGRYLHNPLLAETCDPLSGCAGAPPVIRPGSRELGGSALLGQYSLPVCGLPAAPRTLYPLLPGTAEAEGKPAPEPEEQPLRELRPLPAPSLSAPELPPADSPSPQWGLVIDLRLCTGCQSCTLACRLENNIPLVGKEQLRRGRDMQWLRIDRYLDGSALRHVPVMCRQCANAPCEAVCPVNATVRTSHGLNAMVYPRCWGTRYCSAACPYQARTFNFHDYAASSRATTSLPANPDVTVRTRGVMEKCTLCVQRLNRAKRDGTTPQTACQQACPNGAIRLIDLTRTPLPDGVTTRFDAPGTAPRVYYLS